MAAKGKSSAGSGGRKSRPRAVGTAAVSGLMKPKSSGSRKSSAAMVAEQLPGWKLAAAPVLRSGLMAEEMDVMGISSSTGPSLEQLRRKFLQGSGDADAAAASPVEFADPDAKTVLVQPESGGPAKTADIRRGKVTIVQG